MSWLRNLIQPRNMNIVARKMAMLIIGSDSRTEKASSFQSVTTVVKSENTSDIKCKIPDSAKLARTAFRAGINVIIEPAVPVEKIISLLRRLRTCRSRLIRFIILPKRYSGGSSFIYINTKKERLLVHSLGIFQQFFEFNQAATVAAFYGVKRFAERFRDFAEGKVIIVTQRKHCLIFWEKTGNHGF